MVEVSLTAFGASVLRHREVVNQLDTEYKQHLDGGKSEDEILAEMGVERPVKRPVRHFTAADYQARIARDEPRLEKAKADMDALTRTVDFDHGMINVPLRKRVRTDADLAKYHRLDRRIRDLETRLALNRYRLRKVQSDG
jgi:hypothetical protein